MSTPLTIDLVRSTLRKLLASTAECVQAEAVAAKSFAERKTAADQAWERLRIDLQQQREARRKGLQEEHDTARSIVVKQFDAEENTIDREYATASAEIVQLCERDEGLTEKEYQESSWTLEAIYDAEKKKAREKLETAKRTYADQRQTVQDLRSDVKTLLEDWELIPIAAPGVSAVDMGNEQPAKMVSDRLNLARENIKKLRGLLAPKLLIGDRMLYIGLAACAIAAVGGGLVAFQLMQKTLIPTVGIALASAAIVGGGGTFLARLILRRHADQRVKALCEPLHRALSECEVLCKQGEERDEKVCKEAVGIEKQKYQKEKQVVERKHRELVSAALARRDEAGKEAVNRRDKRKTDLAGRRIQELDRIDGQFRERVTTLDAAADRDFAQAENDYRTQTRRVQEQFDTSFNQLAQQWLADHAEVTANLDTIGEQNNKYFPDWPAPTWQPPAKVPPTMRFGSFTARVVATPKDARLPKPPEQVTLPALLPFPIQCSTLLHAGGAGRGPAAHALLSTALRFLTSLPAGKVRLTIIDPVSLGENFAALMHLADHDPLLVGARIWTEPAQIEKRLSDMTAHMENVIQKYLRSQYASIEEYNAQAGEVAEPYRVLVVANFPANFTAEAARRLERIATSGASCGVYTLVSRDPALPAPQEYNIEDLERASLNLEWKGDRFVWRDTDFGVWPLTIDAPPTNEVLLKTLDKVGKAAKEAGRVEVDFSFIAPPVEKYWTSDSRAGVDVPLGRAGATKRQHLQLGKGTAQHALVAGKTGSGKSTLLHALITNLALCYSPKEIELYLIDFKKGVEFKTYANHHLPHARVIAVESEREFGLSVLQRLDQELKRRGELFRDTGVQDIRGYRESPPVATGGLSMPRIMLIVDEFQEFFVEDDRTAQDAALLLDRLVRQGRAFGLHVLLGSQTLGGAYSLARSTIDQMAVRIALQCSEADAGLILSKDNNAARLLTRPGEAIYNDANGLLEGNDIFQVCWLSEERRERYLDTAARMAKDQGYRPPAPQMVFEGNIPSDLTALSPLRERLADKSPPPVRELTCWLGDAMAIKPPTAALFRRQSASNLLLLGQQPDPCRALFVAATIATLAQTPRGTTEEPRVLLLDGTPADDTMAGYFAKALGTFPGVRVVGPRDVADAMRDLAAELERRQADPATLPPPLLLGVYGLHRHKDLRKADDDFGFNRGGGEPSPAQRFVTLLRDSPASGIHAMVWCDTLVNLQRAVERTTLREFEMKVLFQMSTNDSSTLIDSPAAARLGINRALFAHEELSHPEKFRPYNLPEESWLTEVRKQLLLEPV